VKSARSRVVRRVSFWSVGLGLGAAFLALKRPAPFDAQDWMEIAFAFLCGCLFGCLLGLLTTAYNERRKSLFHIWGWMLLLGTPGFFLNSGGGDVREGLIGSLIGGALGAIIGSFLYSRVSWRLDGLLRDTPRQ
jgi:integral membrane sensor domain MASE1